MDALKEIEQTREEMKKLPKEMQALLVIQKYLEPDYNKDAWLILCHCITNYDKKSKALETIKEKCVGILDLQTSITLGVYNAYKHECYQLTQEEFDLLKEVLR